MATLRRAGDSRAGVEPPPVMHCASLLLPILATSLLAPPTAPPKLPARAANLADFVPREWRTLGEARGDLNGDGLADLVAVLGSRQEENAPPDATMTPRLLLIALAGRGRDGGIAGYRQSVVDGRAVFARNDGGAFGDPFADIRIERGTVVLDHYGGSRERWAYTDRFRQQNGAWEQIGHTSTFMDAFSPDQSRTRDINLNTGRVVETEPPPSRTGSGSKATTRVYHEISAAPAAHPPKWPPENAPLGRTVRLNERADIVQHADAWKGPGDLSAILSATTHAGFLYLRAQVRDGQAAPGDMVRLIDDKGRILFPARTRTRAVAGGYIWQGQYLLSALGARQEEVPLRSPHQGNGYASARLSVSVEVWDADSDGRSSSSGRAATRPIKVLSTSRVGRISPARIRLTRSPRLPCLGSVTDAAFYAD